MGFIDFDNPNIGYVIDPETGNLVQVNSNDPASVEKASLMLISQIDEVSDKFQAEEVNDDGTVDLAREKTRRSALSTLSGLKTLFSTFIQSE